MNSLVCEGRLVAAAVVARLRFAVEIVPVMGALDSSQDESFTITACWRYCKDQEPADPIYSNVFSLFPERWTGKDQSVVKKKKKSWKRSVKSEHWYYDVRLGGRRGSATTGTEGGRRGGQAEGRLFGVDISAVVVKGREWRLLSVHFIPFLMVPF